MLTGLVGSHLPPYHHLLPSPNYPLLYTRLAISQPLLITYMEQHPDTLPGFYTLDPSKPRQLILGPFQGGVACQTIAFSRGVCGYAATHATIQVVNDVAAFPNHIACDSASKSELVVPIVVDGEVKAVIDVDCAVEAGFDEEDALFVNELAESLGKGCDW